ncbi:MAG: movement protein [Cichorium alphacarmovirus 1]|nr:MAG: movement protein [Cichorium alphacarmovirus 1]UVK78461.1 MAG: movement protein [Cichorium alphacarmovirus 1]UVK78464.1 MAG: movement protein [Cichorium alphacarmovirus 1]
MYRVEWCEIEGLGRLEPVSQRTLSPGGHLTALTAVVGLLWLMRSTLRSTLTFSIPPVESLLAVLILALTVLNLTSSLASHSQSSTTYVNDNTKTQYISISK